MTGIEVSHRVSHGDVVWTVMHRRSERWLGGFTEWHE